MGKEVNDLYSLMDKYEELQSKLQKTAKELKVIRKEIGEIEDQTSQMIPARIQHLEKQIEKIDEYGLKIQALRKLAEDHISSKNLQTIEAPPNYRINLNRLRNWSMMIDPMSFDDPYARKLYLVSRCDEKFLEIKRKEFSQRITRLKEELESGNTLQLEALRSRICELEEDRAKYASSEEINTFAAAVKAGNNVNIFPEERRVYDPQTVYYHIPGSVGYPFYFDKEQRILLREKFGGYYSKESGEVFLPLEIIKPDSDFVIAINCLPSRNVISQMDAGVRNFLLNIIDHTTPGLVKILIADEERQNTQLAGTARALQDTFAMEYIPRTQEQMTNMLENVVSSFSDIDELIGDFDSVTEYNSTVDEDKKIQKRVLVVAGWPDSVADSDKRLLQRIIANYDRYGVSLILIRIHSFTDDRKTEKVAGLTEYASSDIIRIDMTAKESLITVGQEKTRPFMWYPFRGNLSSEYIQSLKQRAIKKEGPGNEYTEHFDLVNIPEYKRVYQPINLPYGMDAKGGVHNLSFENENFAAYLVGASRSGKSTLLHTLIAGIIRNYHPDNVELWLADFKQLEFEKYITNLPPHVRYVLLDESTELVYDLIDKLTEKMMERQHLFAQLGKERIDQIDTTLLKEPLPVIFVILDEFSIMSQSLSDSPMYKLRLQNLLAKGAALGIRFLFSSQTFTTGIAGLTLTARAQIQQRIAMKAPREEITETLELSPRLKSDQVRNWMDALPPHYTLVKSRKGPDTPPEVNRHLVLYFKDYKERDRMIQMINQRMHRSDSYEPENINSYVDKHPVLVDGKNFEKFSAEMLLEGISKHRASGNAFEHETYISPGVPRLMSNMKLVTLTEETRENILLLARSSEQACAISVITSFMQAFLLQGNNVSVWAYGKNRLFRAARAEVWNSSDYDGVSFSVDNDEVCDAIYSFSEKIKNRRPGNELIVLIGMDRICGDFEFDTRSFSGITGAVPAFDREEYERKKEAQEKELIKKGAVATTDIDLLKHKATLAWSKERISRMKEYQNQGLSDEDIKKRLIKEMSEFMRQFIMAEKESSDKISHEGSTDEKVSAETKDAPVKKFETSDKPEPAHKPGAYNAGRDFADIVKQGSRLGYHFMMVLNDYSDLKQTMTKTDLYRHRMSFSSDPDTSRELFSSRVASGLSEHICQYSNRMEQFSFRPYIHPGITWEGWYIDEEGKLISPFVLKG